MKFKRKLSCLLAGFLLLLPAAACAEKTPDPSEETPPPAEKPEGVPSTYEISLERPLYLLSADVEAASTLPLSAALTDGKGAAVQGEISFSSADPEVASVQGKSLVAVAPGETTVTATYEKDGKSVSAAATVAVLESAEEAQADTLSRDVVRISGRTYTAAGGLAFDHVLSGVEVAFAGTELSVNFLTGTIGKIRCFIDGEAEGQTYTVLSKKNLKVAMGLENGAHTVRIVKASSPQYGRVVLNSDNAFTTDGSFLKARKAPALKLEFIGDSITAGCGAAGTRMEATPSMNNSDATLGYAFLTAQALGADISAIAQEGICVKDGGYCAYDAYTHVSFSNTGTFDPSTYEADVVVLALGENDMWHATDSTFSYTTEQFRTDYSDMLRLIRSKHPEAKIVCIYGMMPASSTPNADTLIKGAIADTEDTNITSVQMVSNEQGANSHPSADAHRTTAATLTEHIRGLLGL